VVQRPDLVEADVHRRVTVGEGHLRGAGSHQGPDLLEQAAEQVVDASVTSGERDEVVHLRQRTVLTVQTPEGAVGDRGRAGEHRQHEDADRAVGDQDERCVDTRGTHHRGDQGGDVDLPDLSRRQAALVPADHPCHQPAHHLVHGEHDGDRGQDRARSGRFQIGDELVDDGGVHRDLGGVRGEVVRGLLRRDALDDEHDGRPDDPGEHQLT